MRKKTSGTLGLCVLCVGSFAHAQGRPSGLPLPGSAAASSQLPVPPQVGRPLSLRAALLRAMQADLGVAAAIASNERAEVGVLRAQLDRISFRVDTFLTEQWRASNLAGATPTPSCAAALPLGAALVAPVQLLAVNGSGLDAPSQAACESVMGSYLQPDAISRGLLGQFNVSADLRVPVFTGFRVTATVDRAKALQQSAFSAVRDSQRMAALSALRAYWAVRRTDLQQAVSTKALSRFQLAVGVVQARVRAGLASLADINRMETRRLGELSRWQDLTGSGTESRVQLAVALGLGGEPLQLTEGLEHLPVEPPGSADEVDGLLQHAKSSRADLHTLHFQTQVAQQQVRIARSFYFPQLSLSSLIQFSNNPFNPLIGARAANQSANPFTNITGSVFFGGTLSLNLFDMLNTYTAVRDARLEQKRAASEEQRLWRVVESEVRTLHARLVRLYRTAEPQRQALAISSENLGIMERRYKNGDIGILDFIDAQVELLNAEISLTNTSASIAQTWGELSLATGRLPMGADNETSPGDALEAAAFGGRL